jgi:hypothetical protein
MSNSFLFNEATGQREPIKDRAAIMTKLYRKTAKDKAARLTAETAALSADTAPPEILVPKAAPMPDVAGPVGEPAKTAKPTQKS